MRIALPMEVAPAAFRRCDPARPVRTIGGAALGTSWQVRFSTPAPVADAELIAAIEGRLAAIVAEMSQWEPDSLLSRFNRAPAGEWVFLPPDFAAVVDAALEIAARSGGAFDPSHGRAAALLGFGAETVAGPPASARLDEAKTTAGWDRLSFDRAARRLRQPGGLWLDLSGIAKGFAVDALADLMADRSIEDSLVEIGGELVGRGLRPDGQPWWVEIEAPPGARLAPLRLGLHEQAVATSGDYVRGAHTIDPRTGRPLDGRVASVTVVHTRAMLADAWATAFTVAGCAAAIEMASRDGIAVRIVERRDGGFVETFSPAFTAMLGE